MSLQEIVDYMKTGRPYFLKREEVACFVCWQSLGYGDTYFSELIAKLRNDYPGIQVSDTVLNQALDDLGDAGVLLSWTGENTGARGRPRIMLSVEETEETIACSKCWEEFLRNRGIEVD